MLFIIFTHILHILSHLLSLVGNYRMHFHCIETTGLILYLYFSAFHLPRMTDFINRVIAVIQLYTTWKCLSWLFNNAASIETVQCWSKLFPTIFQQSFEDKRRVTIEAEGAIALYLSSNREIFVVTDLCKICHTSKIITVQKSRSNYSRILCTFLNYVDRNLWNVDNHET
jgi:hypothetical protein